MKFKIYKVPERNEDFIGKIEIRDAIANDWYKEQMRRFSYICRLKATEEEKQEYMIENPVFDTDESYELGMMSIDHLQALFNYYKNHGNY